MQVIVLQSCWKYEIVLLVSWSIDYQFLVMIVMCFVMLIDSLMFLNVSSVIQGRMLFHVGENVRF